MIVGIIGDTHFPFCHKDYLKFVKKTFKEWGVQKIVHIGDEVDNHAISYHESDSSGLSAGDEMNEAMKELKKWYKVFPKVDVLVGNHSALPFRQAASAGLPKRMIKPYEEMWEAPNGWKWHDEIIIDKVMYQHGTGSSGQNGAIKRAVNNRMSTVIGHCHAFGGVNYTASDRDLIFGMNVGCGIDIKSYAMAYGKAFSIRPTLGCGIVVSDREAYFIPMNLGTKIEYK